MEIVHTHQHQSKMPFRSAPSKRRRHVSVVGVVVGVVLVALSMSMLALVLVSLQTGNQDWRQQATVPEGRVQLQTSVNPSSPRVGEAISILVAVNTFDLQIDGLQLTLSFPNSVSRPVATVPTGGPLKIVHQRVVTANQEQVLKVLLTSTTDGAAFRSASMTPVLVVAFQASSGGTLVIEPDNLNSLATAYGSVPPRDELARLNPIQITVADDGQAPTNTPTPTPSPTPGLTNPTNTPTPSPTPPLDPDQPYLVISYLHQGVPRREGVSLDTWVWLVPMNTLDSFSTQTANPATAQRTQSLSTPEGVVTQPIPIYPMPDAQRVAVFVKTAQSLRRNLGVISLTPDSTGSNQITVDLRAQNKQVLVGDFVQTPTTEFNQINLLDLASILEHYTQLQKPITPTIRQYDVNFDNVLSIFDIALVLSNYTELSVRGD